VQVLPKGFFNQFAGIQPPQAPPPAHHITGGEVAGAVIGFGLAALFGAVLYALCKSSVGRFLLLAFGITKN
jgi:hypothetical protein